MQLAVTTQPCWLTQSISAASDHHHWRAIEQLDLIRTRIPGDTQCNSMAHLWSASAIRRACQDAPYEVYSINGQDILKMDPTPDFACRCQHPDCGWYIPSPDGCNVHQPREAVSLWMPRQLQSPPYPPPSLPVSPPDWCHKFAPRLCCILNTTAKLCLIQQYARFEGDTSITAVCAHMSVTCGCQPTLYRLVQHRQTQVKHSTRTMMWESCVHKVCSNLGMVDADSSRR
jgi:hypothetical protein